MALELKSDDGRPLQFWVPACGTYLTDHKRLVEVVKADRAGVIAHDSVIPLDNDAVVVAIPLVELAEGKWETVMPRG